jgi:hypothetical protein
MRAEGEVFTVTCEGAQPFTAEDRSVQIAGKVSH